MKLWKCLIIYVNWVRLYIWELGWFGKNDFLVWNEDGFWELIFYIPKLGLALWGIKYLYMYIGLALWEN